MTTIEPVAVTGFVTIPNVELVSVGDWSAMSGQETFTTDDLAASIAAYNEPGGKAPRCKIGHVDSGIGATPAFGRYENLRLSEDGMTVIGDHVACPAWLAEILPSAFPSRSIEGRRNAKSCATGRSYQLVIDAVSVLGIELPAVESLADLQAMFSPDGPTGLDGGEKFVAQRGEAVTKVQAAGVSDNDIWPAFNAEYDWRYWIREVFIDPMQLIVSDDEAGPDDPKLYRLPFTTSGGAIKFGELTPVEVEYVDVPDAGKVAASQQTLTPRPVRVFTSRSESRPANTTPQEDPMDTASIISLLDLPAETTAEQAEQALERAKSAAATEPTTSDDTGSDDGDGADAAAEEASVPEAVAASLAENGLVAVPRETLDALRSGMEQGVAARASQLTAERDRVVTAAADDGKIPAATKPDWVKRWDGEVERTGDAAETRAWLASLPAVLPVGKPHGRTTGPVTAGNDRTRIRSVFPELSKLGKEG